MQRVTPPLSVLLSPKVVLLAHRQPGSVCHTQWDHRTCHEVRLLFLSCETHLGNLRFSAVCLLYLMNSRKPCFLLEQNQVLLCRAAQLTKGGLYSECRTTFSGTPVQEKANFVPERCVCMNVCCVCVSDCMLCLCTCVLVEYVCTCACSNLYVCVSIQCM